MQKYLIPIAESAAVNTSSWDSATCGQNTYTLHTLFITARGIQGEKYCYSNANGLIICGGSHKLIAPHGSAWSEVKVLCP